MSNLSKYKKNKIKFQFNFQNKYEDLKFKLTITNMNESLCKEIATKFPKTFQFMFDGKVYDEKILRNTALLGFNFSKRLEIEFFHKIKDKIDRDNDVIIIFEKIMDKQIISSFEKFNISEMIEYNSYQYEHENFIDNQPNIYEQLNYHYSITSDLKKHLEYSIKNLNSARSELDFYKSTNGGNMSRANQNMKSMMIPINEEGDEEMEKLKDEIDTLNRQNTNLNSQVRMYQAKNREKKEKLYKASTHLNDFNKEQGNSCDVLAKFKNIIEEIMEISKINQYHEIINYISTNLSECDISNQLTVMSQLQKKSTLFKKSIHKEYNQDSHDSTNENTNDMINEEVESDDERIPFSKNATIIDLDDHNPKSESKDSFVSIDDDNDNQSDGLLEEINENDELEIQLANNSEGENEEFEIKVEMSDEKVKGDQMSSNSGLAFTSMQNMGDEQLGSFGSVKQVLDYDVDQQFSNNKDLKQTSIVQFDFDSDLNANKLVNSIRGNSIEDLNNQELPKLQDIYSNENENDSKSKIVSKKDFENEKNKIKTEENNLQLSSKDFIANIPKKKFKDEEDVNDKKQSLPTNPNSVLTSNSNIPKTVPSIPQSVPKIPNSSQSIPIIPNKTIPIIPQSVPKIPNTSQSIPIIPNKTVPSIPQSVPKIPSSIIKGQPQKAPEIPNSLFPTPFNPNVPKFISNEVKKKIKNFSDNYEIFYSLKTQIEKKHKNISFFTLSWQEISILNKNKTHVFICDQDNDPILNSKFDKDDYYFQTFIKQFSEEIEQKRDRAQSFINPSEKVVTQKKNTIEKFPPSLAQNLMIIMNSIIKNEPEIEQKLIDQSILNIEVLKQLEMLFLDMNKPDEKNSNALFKVYKIRSEIEDLIKFHEEQEREYVISRQREVERFIIELIEQNYNITEKIRILKYNQDYLISLNNIQDKINQFNQCIEIMKSRSIRCLIKWALLYGNIINFNRENCKWYNIVSFDINSLEKMIDQSIRVDKQGQKFEFQFFDIILCYLTDHHEQIRNINENIFQTFFNEDNKSIEDILNSIDSFVATYDQQRKIIQNQQDKSGDQRFTNFIEGWISPEFTKTVCDLSSKKRTGIVTSLNETYEQFGYSSSMPDQKRKDPIFKIFYNLIKHIKSRLEIIYKVEIFRLEDKKPNEKVKQNKEKKEPLIKTNQNNDNSNKRSKIKNKQLIKDTMNF